MREHKFRACIPSINKVCFGGKGLSLRRIWRLDESYFSPDVVWLQYTGLKDKNGKEIYEGDIVANKYVQLPVTFRLGSFMWGEQLRLAEAMEAIEVIGNIYENKELLEEEKCQN